MALSIKIRKMSRWPVLTRNVQIKKPDEEHTHIAVAP